MMEPEAQEETRAASNAYTIRPDIKEKFRPVVVKELIHKVLMEKLNEKQYSSEQAKTWTKEISDTIITRLKELSKELREKLHKELGTELGLDRYKYVVQVVIGEQRGEGVKMGCRCFWDSDTDSYAQDIFMNDTLFCVAAAYGVYYY